MHAHTQALPYPAFRAGLLFETSLAAEERVRFFFFLLEEYNITVPDHAHNHPTPPPQTHSPEDLFLFLLAQVLHRERLEAQGGRIGGLLTPQAAFENCLPLLADEFAGMRPEFLLHVVQRSRHLRQAPLGNAGVRAAAAVLGALREEEGEAAASSSRW
jgi:hypothetical protein